MTNESTTDVECMAHPWMVDCSRCLFIASHGLAAWALLNRLQPQSQISQYAPCTLLLQRRQSECIFGQTHRRPINRQTNTDLPPLADPLGVENAAAWARSQTIIDLSGAHYLRHALPLKYWPETLWCGITRANVVWHLDVRIFNNWFDYYF